MVLHIHCFLVLLVLIVNFYHLIFIHIELRVYNMTLTVFFNFQLKHTLVHVVVWGRLPTAKSPNRSVVFVNVLQTQT